MFTKDSFLIVLFSSFWNLITTELNLKWYSAPQGRIQVFGQGGDKHFRNKNNIEI